MRKNTIIPIEAFDPRLRTMLKEGCLKRVEIPCTSSEQRTALRNQLMNFRARNREQNGPDANELYRCQIVLGPVEGEGEARRFLLIIHPRGAQFDDALRAANISDVIEQSARPSKAEGGDLLDNFKVEE